ncbi:hypothetical protein [Spirosoma linguale]|uniref:Cupin 2 conserved barrel domain protein n=1 Tax=Spirosoma linguale (strain ATCC 33905 / DSM 74 / LMG 10896 / Claus 1) TaxID=504472 RepID=D2QGX6_SPILD|nr:hypothetical protein Slin_5176 [Spirosoma linguale DSM 74]
MKSFLLFWVFMLFARQAFPQAVLSTVFSYSHSAVSVQTGHEERTLAEGTTRDFPHFLIQAITLEANQPTQPVQQLDEEVILLVRSGELTLMLGGKHKTLVPGSVVMVMPGDDYRVENKASQPLTYYLIRYTSNEMPDLDLYRLLGGSFWADWREIAPTTNQQGSSRKLSPYPTIMSDRVAMEFVSINAGMAGQPVHRHRAAELLLILDHPVQVPIDGAQKEAQVGDLIFIESDVEHGINPARPEGCSYVSVVF